MRIIPRRSPASERAESHAQRMLDTAGEDHIRLQRAAETFRNASIAALQETYSQRLGHDERAGRTTRARACAVKAAECYSKAVLQVPMPVRSYFTSPAELNVQSVEALRIRSLLNTYAADALGIARDLSSGYRREMLEREIADHRRAADRDSNWISGFSRKILKEQRRQA